MRMTRTLIVRHAPQQTALASWSRLPSRRDADASVPACWPPTMTTAAPALATANPSSLRLVIGSPIKVARSAVASGIVVGMMSALSDAGVSCSPRNARLLKPRNPKAAAAVTGRQRCSGSGVRVARARSTKMTEAAAKRMVESSSGGALRSAILAAIHWAESASAAVAYASTTIGRPPTRC